MKYDFTNYFRGEVNKIRKQNQKLYLKIFNKLKIFSENPKHNSLRLHKLKGELSNSWSISIEKNYRLVFQITENKYIFYDLGTHDQVYRK